MTAQKQEFYIWIGFVCCVYSSFVVRSSSFALHESTTQMIAKFMWVIPKLLNNIKRQPGEVPIHIMCHYVLLDGIELEYHFVEICY